MYTIKTIKQSISSVRLKKKWDSIASYMDDEIREDLHAKLSPCSREKFLAEYLNCDPDFSNILVNKFIDIML